VKISPLVRVQFAIKLVGAAAVVAYCVTSSPQPLGKHWFLALLVFAVEAATQISPFAVIHEEARQEFSADMMVVVAAALLLPTPAAVVAISCGFALGFVLRGAAGLDRLDDISSQIMCAFLAFTVGHLVGQPGLGWNSIVGATVAAVIYEVFGGVLLTIWSVFAKHTSFWPFFWAGLSDSTAAYPWLICLGLLLAVIGSNAPWALPLMGAPLALVLMAARSRVEATEDRSRLDGLLKATTNILAATTVSAVTEAATNAISDLFESQIGRFDVNIPSEGELGALLTTEHLNSQYLVAEARDTLMPRYTEQDRRLLETLASVTASAMDKAALHEDVTEQATRDPLTGLANRRAFERELQTSSFGHRSTDASGVMFLDLDGFKKINDEHGHKAGDEVLVETAKRLLESVRSGDTVARLGGDEFTVLLRGVHNRGEVAIVADRILEAMRHPVTLASGVKVRTTPSLGIALAHQAETDATVMLKDADAAMYEAKRAGKDCWRLAQDPAMASE
jgi:diguanylate cyclase (GGDEF)-like protein